MPRVGETTRKGSVNGLPVDLPLEVRVHGRGGQGGVTCAKLIATLYAQTGLHVQTFGDYGAERSGAPIRAYTRVSRETIRNRNKVYEPDHLLVLDPGLLGPDVLEGAKRGALLVVNTSERAEGFERRYAGFRVGTVDATAIARWHGIGTRSVVIVNTTIVGAYARVAGLPLDLLEKAFAYAGLAGNLGAAREAYESVFVHPYREEIEAAPRGGGGEAAAAGLGGDVVSLLDHVRDTPTPLKTGSWRTQLARYEDRLAPCSNACPAGNDVVGFLQALRDEGVAASARILGSTQPLPSVCGRVCPGFCMEHCNRGAFDGAVNIRSLERWVGDQGEGEARPPEGAERPLRLAVVGAGPAGLGAAFAAASEGHRVTLFERDRELGGLLRTGIPAYRLPEEALDRDLARLLALGVEARCDQVVDRADLWAMTEQYDAVVLATGLQKGRRLDGLGPVPAGVGDGLEFLRRLKEGTAAPLSGHVVVVGGGNSALDCARSALRTGAEAVTLVYRRSRDEMPAIADEVEDALKEGVQLLALRQPVGFSGVERVEAVHLAEVALGSVDAGGRRRPVVTDRVGRLPCRHVLLALGQSADLGLLPEGWEVRAGRAFRGPEPTNLWLAGDVATAEGTVAHAIGHGRRVASWALRAQGAEPMPLPGPPVDSAPPVTADEVSRAHDRVRPPQADVHRTVEVEEGSFDEVNLGLPDAAEAERCFSCGRCNGCDTCLVYCPDGIIRRRGERYVIDEDYCKGCGLCAAECPRKAIEMVQEIGRR